MKKILTYTTFALFSAASIFTGYASANIKDSSIENSLQLPYSRWRLVKHAFRLHIPQNKNPLSQLIIDAPSSVAVSNDIDVLDKNGQRVHINVSVNARRIIIAFPDPVISDTHLLVEFNKVKQPINGPASVYRLSAKVVGNNEEIPLGIAQFSTF